MRLLIGVVHYYKAGDGRHGSVAADPAPRVQALAELILQLHRLFGAPAAMLNHMARCVQLVDDQAGTLSLRVCVSGDAHVLPQLAHLQGLFQPVDCEPQDPRLLGFACQRHLAEAWVAAEAAGEPYDYVAYLEDDIVLSDADFFLKLACFNAAFGDRYLLMPNRLETLERKGQLSRFYIDGDYNPAASEVYRQSGSQQLCLEHLGQAVRFEQPFNLHSGCFFLNRAQASTYFQSGHAGVEDVSFHGPLESAATLGVLKTFQLMKPALSNGRFLTVIHAGRNFMGLVPQLT